MPCVLCVLSGFMMYQQLRFPDTAFTSCAAAAQLVQYCSNITSLLTGLLFLDATDCVSSGRRHCCADLCCSGVGRWVHCCGGGASGLGS
jgi:hypothetical protein